MWLNIATQIEPAAAISIYIYEQIYRSISTKFHMLTQIPTMILFWFQEKIWNIYTRKPSFIRSNPVSCFLKLKISCCRVERTREWMHTEHVWIKAIRSDEMWMNKLRCHNKAMWRGPQRKWCMHTGIVWHIVNHIVVEFVLGKVLPELPDHVAIVLAYEHSRYRSHIVYTRWYNVHIIVCHYIMFS